MSDELVNSIISALADKKLRKVIERIIEKEEELRRKYPKQPSWWDWEVGDVGVEPWYILKLMRMGIVKRTYSSSRHRYYRLVNYELTKKLLQQKPLTVKHEKSKSKLSCLPVPNSYEELFDVVVGYDDYKWVLWKALKLWEKRRKPAHFLLVGPPASGKTLVMECIERKLGCVEYVAGEAARRGGFTERIYNAYRVYGRHFILEIDEIDKMDAEAKKIIYNLMEGKLNLSVSGKQVYDPNVSIMVIATSNQPEKIPEALMSRFGQPLIFTRYDKDTYINVVEKVLVRVENVDPTLAKTIAIKTAEEGVRDPRVARQIARMVETPEDIEKAVKILLSKKLFNF